jgi:hypothetical protein
MVLMAQWWVVNKVSRPGGPRGPQQTNYVIEEAASRPINTVAGPYATKAEAESWQSGANSAGNSPGSAAAGAANAIGNATGLTSVSNFLSSLSSRSMWIRIGEVLVGIALIIVGVDHLTSTTSAIGKAAHTVAKGAMLA